MQVNLTEFDDIRPYNDSEVRPTLQRLLSDNEFLDTIIRLKMPSVVGMAAPLMRPMARKMIGEEMDGIHTVDDFQKRVESYMRKNLDETITGLSVSGLQHLSKERAYCFVSNHRDIVMDPAFVNWVLFHNGFKTLRIAIGDNLLTKPFASDLMRLNKSFIVNRSATGPKDKLRAAKKLSAYIHHSLVGDQANIWIAQREGRAKDSLDITNPAIISMLALSRSKEEPFSDWLARIAIVPVSISYEFDPCDEAKARELTLLARDGHYKKGEHEDVASIAKGITGKKGRVHLAFGSVLSGELHSAEDVASVLDRVILDNYVLQPTHGIAYEMLEQRSLALPVTDQQILFNTQTWDSERQLLQQRIDACDPQWRAQFLQNYANPVYAKLAAAS